MHIGEKIRKIRDLRGISQEYMAEKLQLSQQAYSMLEKDTNIPFGRLEQIAKALDTQVENIVGFDEKYVFNIMHNETGNGQVIHQFPMEMKKLYEDKIALLEEKIKWLEKELEK